MELRRIKKLSDAISYEQFELIRDKNNCNMEYYNGIVIHMHATTPKHEHIVFTMTRALKDFFANTKCSVHSSQVAVKLQSENSIFECVPDIFVECENKFKKSTFIGTPLIIVEVLSDSTAENDTEIKKSEYAKAGIREYLIVSQKHDYIRQYILEDGMYILKTTLSKNDVYSSYVFDELSFEVKQVFERTRGTHMPKSSLLINEEQK